jgi:hypothetical protein
MNDRLSMLRTVIPAHAGIQGVAALAITSSRQTSDRGEGAAPTTTPSPSRGEGWGGGESSAWVVRLSGSPLSLTLPREGGGDVVVLGLSALGKGELACITTTTPSPLTGEGGGEGERGQPTQPSLVRPKPTPTLSFPPDGPADYLWEARPGGDARLDAPRMFDRGEGAAPTTTPSPSRGEGWGGGDRVVDMPQCVFGARRPSHRSSQVPPPNPSPCRTSASSGMTCLR